MADKPGILMVSKPVVPPWNDSARNLVRDLAAAGQRYRYHLMATKGAPPVGGDSVLEPIYAGQGTYAAGLAQNRAVLMRLLKPDRLPLYHFFFAPNRVTSTAAKLILALKRRKSVHTICSQPRSFEGLDRLLFADVVVTLSRYTQSLFERHCARRVVHIPPCVPVGTPVDETRKEAALARLGLAGRQVVLFAGDYEFSNASTVCLKALPAILRGSQAQFLFACRIKREGSRQVEAVIRGEVEAMGLGRRVSFANEVPDMEALAAAVALNVLPADSLYAKMDIPLVLLESLREGVPVVASDHGPLAELMAHEVGAMVPAGDHEALAAAVVELLSAREERERLGANGRKLVASKFSPAEVAARYEEVYDQLLGRAGGVG
jgi:glycosyltransferase involved in cell wall biosynthesis